MGTDSQCKGPFFVIHFVFLTYRHKFPMELSDGHIFNSSSSSLYLHKIEFPGWVWSSRRGGSTHWRREEAKICANRLSIRSHKFYTSSFSSYRVTLEGLRNFQIKSFDVWVKNKTELHYSAEPSRILPSFKSAASCGLYMTLCHISVSNTVQLIVQM